MAIIPEKRLGVALKITVGADRAKVAAITALLVRLGVLEPEHPVVAHYLTAPLQNCGGKVTGEMRLAAGFA